MHWIKSLQRKSNIYGTEKPFCMISGRCPVFIIRQNKIHLSLAETIRPAVYNFPLVLKIKNTI